MTTLNDAKKSVYDRFVLLWLAATPIVLDNEELEEPPESAWVRVTVQQVGRSQNTLGAVGNRKMRSTATAFVQVYTRTNQGTSEGDLLAQTARDIFDAVSFDGLDFLAADISEEGVDEKWYVHLVSAEFDYEQIK